MDQEFVGEQPLERNLEEAEAVAVKRRSVRGLAVLLARTGVFQIIAIVATFLLTIFLDPAHYGVFAVVAAAVDILVYFSDIGLAGALIQKKEVSEDDLATTFTIQQLLSIALVVVGFAATSIVSRTYHLSPAGILLFRALLVSFFLSTLKTIPSILLERNLEFGKLVIPQLIETVSFYSIAVFLAWRGFGVTSFTFAVLVRSALGLIAVYLVKPWRPRIGFHRHSFKSLASFGVPFQANSLLGLIKDRMLVVYYGAVLPAASVGYLQWAERWSLFPLRIVVDNVNKVTFPAYSRLQEKKDVLVRAIEKSLFFTGLIIFPVLIGMVIVSPTILLIVPKYQKWQPALIALALFAVNGLWSSVSTTLTNAFAAIGKININLKLMAMWTMLTWIVTPIFLKLYGYNGVALASALIASTSILPMIIVTRLLPVRLLPSLMPPFLSALVMGGVLWLFRHTFGPQPLALIFLVGLGAILYGTVLFLLMGRRLFYEFDALRRLLRP